MKTENKFLFKVEINPVNSDASFIRFRNGFSYKTPNNYSVEVHSMKPGMQHLDMGFYLRTREEVGQAKQICMDSNYAVLFLKSDSDYLAKLARLKIEHSRNQAMKVLDFAKEYKTLAKQMKSGRWF